MVIRKDSIALRLCFINFPVIKEVRLVTLQTVHIHSGLKLEQSNTIPLYKAILKRNLTMEVSFGVVEQPDRISIFLHR